MVIFKKDKGGSHGVGGKQLQKEENASEKFSLEASLKQDGVGVSLYREKTEERQRRRKKRERSQPAISTSHRLRERAVHPHVLLFYTHNRFSLVQFGLDPAHPGQTQPGCSGGLGSPLQGAQPRSPAPPGPEPEVIPHGCLSHRMTGGRPPMQPRAGGGFKKNW